MTDLSIIIVSWNSQDVLGDCLASLEREVIARTGASRLATETLVVDNASQDGTRELVRQRFPFAELIPLAENRGFAGGCNVGLGRAKGRCLALLNSDTIVRRDALEGCVRHLDANPDVAIVGPQLLHPDGSRQNSIHNEPGLLAEIVPKGVLEALFPRRFPSKRFEHAAPLDVEAVLGACLVVRRDALEQVGPLSEDYFFFLEETEWCARMRRAGWRVVHLPDARVVHLSGAGSKRKLPAETRIEYHRSLYRFFRSRRGALAAATLVALRFTKALLYVVVELPAALVSRRARSRWWTRFRVLLWHLRGCPEGWGLAKPSRPGQPQAGRP